MTTNQVMMNAMREARGVKAEEKAIESAGFDVKHLSTSERSIAIANAEAAHDALRARAYELTTIIMGLEAIGCRDTEQEWAIFKEKRMIRRGYWSHKEACDSVTAAHCADFLPKAINVWKLGKPTPRHRDLEYRLHQFKDTVRKIAENKANLEVYRNGEHHEI